MLVNFSWQLQVQVSIIFFLQDSILNSVPENAYGCTFYMPNDHTFKIMQSMALHSEENDKETKLVRKVWKRMEEDKGFARCLLMYHLVPGKKDKFKNNKTRETGKYQYDTSVQPAVNGGRPVQIQVDYKKGEKAKISTFLDKVEVIGEDKFADANPKPTCMIHVINGIILPYDPGGGQNISIQLCFHLKWRMFFYCLPDKIDSQTCVPKDKSHPPTPPPGPSREGELPGPPPPPPGGDLGDIMKAAQENCQIVQVRDLPDIIYYQVTKA